MKMRAFLVIGLGALLFLAGGRASAADVAARPFELGLSSGYSSGGVRHDPHSAAFDTLWAIPLFLDLDYRLSKHWSVGAYGEVGFIDISPDVEDAEESTQGHHYRFGVEAIYHSAPERRVQPWLGAGFGFDALRATYRIRSTFPPFDGAPPDPGSSSPVRASGFELVHAQLGIDFVVAPAFAIGPFVGASVVAYRNRRGIASSEDYTVWANIGLKATLRL